VDLNYSFLDVLLLGPAQATPSCAFSATDLVKPNSSAELVSLDLADSIDFAVERGTGGPVTSSSQSESALDCQSLSIPLRLRGN
jgi:hypothetical protein